MAAAGHRPNGNGRITKDAPGRSLPPRIAGHPVPPDTPAEHRGTLLASALATIALGLLTLAVLTRARTRK
jgi:hypothetical protein